MIKCNPSIWGSTLFLSSLFLAGCVTTQGGGLAVVSRPKIQPSTLGISDLTDAFSPQMRDLKRLVADNKFSEADALFVKEREYFVKRFQKPAALPNEIKKLGDFVWKTRYLPKVNNALSSAETIQDLHDSNLWPGINRVLKTVTQVGDAIDGDPLLLLTKSGSPERLALNEQVKRIEELAKTYRPLAIASTFEKIVNLGKHSDEYVGSQVIIQIDYISSAAFQSLALQKIKSLLNREEYTKKALLVGPYLSQLSKNSVDMHFVDLVREEFTAGGQISLDKVLSLGSIKTPFGESKKDLSKLVTVAHVDLTSSGFKNLNLFDFQILFKQDMAVEFSSADKTIFNSAEISRFDYVFVTELSAAKVSRQFKDKKETQSRAKTGSRQVQNPDYIRAISQYQQSMAEFQRIQINSAIPKYCQGWGCALQGVADGIAQGAARSNVDSTSAILARTSQTLTEPEYSAYAYQIVEINTTKSAAINYYVIDVKKKRIYKSNFEIKDQETFNVAYNVREEDPDKSSILRNLKKEDEVTEWEKKPMTVSMSTLFSPANVRSASATPYSDLYSFLKPPSTRVYASAAPTFTQGQSEDNEPSASRASSGTIADKRFDSIVILKNAKSLGTGFYVTPDLILTAYHVVRGSDLVEITYYDGTKSYGKVIDHDIRLDLALIKAQTVGKPLKIHSGLVRLGETVEAIGHPKGYEFTITRGIISSMRKQRSAAIGSTNLVEFVQTDTPISKGNSGGPLLLKDTVIGVNDWMRVDKDAQNLNFSVSFNEIREYLDRFSGK